MSKEPKPCPVCEGTGTIRWTARNGMARGVRCDDCKGTGKTRPIHSKP